MKKKLVTIIVPVRNEDKNLDNILHPLKNGFHNVAFLLGIGYRDQDMPYFKNKRKPTIDEIVTWK